MTAGRHREAARPGAALKKRRGEVFERLAAYGLARGPHRVVRASRRADDAADLGRRLRLALEGLGPVFSSFGLYLSTRVDLLEARDCLELAAADKRAAPMTAAAARGLFGLELGLDPGDAFLAFDDEPFESGLLHQSHRARLQDGEPVVVKLVRPEAVRHFLCDVDLLGLLEGALSGVLHGGPNFRAAVADFTSTLRQQLDLAHEAKALETLARDSADFEMLRVPRVLGGLSAGGVLTVEELAGVPVDAAEFGGGARRGLPPASDRTALARLLCSVWLRQALLGHAFPVEPRGANLLVVSDRQVAFTGGLFGVLHVEAQKNLFNYLLATSAESPDRACSCLLAEVLREGRPGADEDLRHRFRQVVPFRDSGWYVDDDTNRLAEHLVVHWRSAAECGYVPRPHLPSFYRGLFAITSAAQRLSPESDPLLEGLQDTRLQESLSRVREMLNFNSLGDQADRYAAMFMGMPGRIDEMLTLASEGSPRFKIRAPEAAASGRRQRNSGAAVTALLLVLAGAVMWLPRVTAAFVDQVWADRVNAVVFVFIGAIILRAATRG
jgi:ubiquinone biosynthesis protein